MVEQISDWPEGSGYLFDEDFAQARLAEGVVLEVEAVEAVERVFVRVHVQRVHIQLVPAHTKPYL